VNQEHNTNTRRLVEAVLTSPGETNPALRYTVEAYAAELGGRPDEQAGKLPAELAEYVTKVALHAYKTTDEDTEALQQAGYSEDAIFEITLSAVLGAGMARLERGLAVLKGDER
jgi:alkylhydroperoxidase family enzyme